MLSQLIERNVDLMRIQFLAFAMLLGLSAAVYAQRIPAKPKVAAFVNDYAQMLSSSEKAALEQKLLQYDQSTSTQIVVATVGSLKAYDAGSIESLANSWAESWGIGQKGADNGMLILISKNDRKVRLEVGYGLEGYIPDLRASQLIEQYIVPNFRNGNYYKGVDNLTTAIFRLLEGGFSESDRAPKASDSTSFIFVAVIVAVILAIVVVVFWNSTRGAHKQRYRRIGQILEDRRFWKDLEEIYYPDQVAAKKDELENRYALLSISYKSKQPVKELYDKLVALKHQGHKFFTMRNDAKLRKANKKLKQYLQDPIYDKQSALSVQEGLSRELAYFAEMSTVELSYEDKQRLMKAQEHYGLLISQPERLLVFNAGYLSAKIQSALNDDRFWNAFKSKYTSSSIRSIRDKWRHAYPMLLHTPDEREKGIQLYQFYTQKIERLRSMPHRFLKRKPQPKTTTYTTMSGSSYGGGGFSMGGGSSSSGGSSFGGGSFGGGGASGSW